MRQSLWDGPKWKNETIFMDERSNIVEEKIK